MKCIEYAREYVTQLGFHIIEEDEKQLNFKYQMNSIHLWGDDNDENFVMITLPNFSDVTPQNLIHVKNLCNEVNKEVKQVKVYVINDLIIAAAEIYFVGQEDFNYQMQMALNNLIVAKMKYAKLDADY